MKVRTAGTHGNSIGVSICGNATAYEQNLGSSNQTVGEDAVGATTIKVDDGTAFGVGDLISFSTADASSTATNPLAHSVVMKVMSMKSLRFPHMTLQFV